MRIVAGKAKGTKLASIPGLNTRPTSDRVKEALFNILGPSIQSSSFLDLYAGSGGMGLEALSRGAEKVVWIDSNPACIAQIQKNLDKTRLAGGALITMDVLRGLAQLHREKECFDFIFLDPPYDQGLVGRTLQCLDDLSLLTTGGIIIAETSKKEEGPLEMSKLCQQRKRRYGETMLLFYEAKGELG